jgi:hypothetical protein
VAITVEYFYDRLRQPSIESAKRCADHHPVKLTDAERERIETWINEHRFFDDHAE